MSGSGFWRSDWFLGLVIALLLLMTISSTFVQSLERWAYDVGVRAPDREPSRRIAVIGVDDQSIANIGRWPWPRDVHAKMIDLLADSGAKAVGYMSLFFEPQRDPGLQYIDRLIGVYQDLPLEYQSNLDVMATVQVEAEDALNTDRKLSSSISSARNVALPILFELGEPQVNPGHPLPDYFLSNELANVVDRVSAIDQHFYPGPARAAVTPISEVAGGANAIGHLNAIPDVDGSTRSEPLVLRYYDRYFPSISLMLAAGSLNLGPKDVEFLLERVYGSVTSPSERTRFCTC